MDFYFLLSTFTGNEKQPKYPPFNTGTVLHFVRPRLEGAPGLSRPRELEDRRVGAQQSSALTRLIHRIQQNDSSSTC